MTINCEGLTQSSVTRIIHRNGGLKCFLFGTGYLTGSRSNILWAIWPVKFCHRSNAFSHGRSNICPCDGRMF